MATACCLKVPITHPSISSFAVYLSLGHSGSHAVQMSSWISGAKWWTPFILFLLIHSLKVTVIYEGFNIDRLLDGMFSLLAQHDLILHSHHCCILPLLNHRLYSGAGEQDSKRTCSLLKAATHSQPTETHPVFWPQEKPFLIPGPSMTTNCPYSCWRSWLEKKPPAVRVMLLFPLVLVA